ncbi:DoxX family membrane protein [Syntrophomonas erecta]
MLRQHQIAKVLWTVLRIYVGWSWLHSGLGKVMGEKSAVWVGSKAGVAVTGFLNGSLQKATGPHPDVQWWYAWFIQHLALPNAKVFSYMVAYGEILVGLALIMGAFTTVALLAGMMMNFNYLFAGTVSSNPVFILEQLVLLWAGSAALYYGLDRMILPVIRNYLKYGNLKSSTQNA